ncbi:MAG: hypothetical protein RLZZ15_707 [Verrucomicrobiota bacterium]|jgi:hypothetical protein
MTTYIDEAQNSANLALDDVLGTANAALDTWAKWNAAKAANTAAKVAIPTTAAPLNRAAGGGGFSVMAYLPWIVGGVVALGGLFLFLRRK